MKKCNRIHKYIVVESNNYVDFCWDHYFWIMSKWFRYWIAFLLWIGRIEMLHVIKKIDLSISGRESLAPLGITALSIFYIKYNGKVYLYDITPLQSNI